LRQKLANAVIDVFCRRIGIAPQLYDRRSALRDGWLNYNARAERLRQITKSANELASSLTELDVLSHDDLAAEFGPKKIEELVGSLRILGKKTQTLENAAQQVGRPRELVIWNASSPHYRRALGASKGERLWRMQV
jgi:hypothetical protein